MFIMTGVILKIIKKEKELCCLKIFEKHVKAKYSMEEGKPLGGQWNYDELNRKIPKGLEIPSNKNIRVYIYRL